jgi:site-specific DNA recombinase
MKKIAVYARVSSEQQAQQATVESQVAALKTRAENDGQVVLPQDVYIDEGFSGATLVRPALERLRDRAADGAIDMIYVHSPDRFARKYAYQVLLLDEFRRCGVDVVFLHGPAGRSAEDELLVQVQGMIAEYERAKILERCRRGKIHRVRLGSVNPLSGAPYGFAYVKKGDGTPASYRVLLHEAKVVREIFGALVREQKSIGEIVRDLNAKNIPTRRNAPRWDRTTVWGILKNPAYMGKAAFGKTEVSERQRPLRPIRSKAAAPRRAKSTCRDKPQDEWITVDVPAIVSSDLFQAAQQQLARNKQLSQRNGRGERYLLQGLTVCARCGYAFYGKTVSKSAAKGGVRYGYYRCIGGDAYRFAGGRICSNPQVRVDQLDDHVWESVRALLQDPSRLLAEWSRRQQSDGGSVDLRERRDEAARNIAAQERSLKRLVDAYEMGALDVKELKLRSDAMRDRIERSRGELVDAERRLQETINLRAVITRIEDFAARVREGLHALSWMERRQLIRTLVAKVEIDEVGATVTYRLSGAEPLDGSSSGGPARGADGSPAKRALGASKPGTGRSDASCQLRGRRDLAGSRKYLPARGPGRVVRTRSEAAAEGPRVSDPLCGRRGAGIFVRRRCAAGAGSAAEALREIRANSPPGEDPACAICAEAARR